MATEFPIRGSDTFNAMAPHPVRHSKLGLDHDGDTTSFIPVMAKESLKEVKQLMNKKEFYIGPDGRFHANLENDTVKYVMHNLTGV